MGRRGWVDASEERRLMETYKYNMSDNIFMAIDKALK